MNANVPQIGFLTILLAFRDLSFTILLTRKSRPVVCKRFHLFNGKKEAAAIFVLRESAPMVSWWQPCRHIMQRRDVEASYCVP